MRQFTRKSAVFVAISTITFLSGCSDNGPSEGTIKKQIAAKYELCKLMSVRDFKKLNGYPQNDGTYIASVRYTLVLTPSDKMVDYVKDFEKKENRIKQSVEDDKPKAQETRSKIESMRNACQKTHDQEMSDLPQPAQVDPGADIKILQLENVVRDDQRWATIATNAMQHPNPRLAPTTQAKVDELNNKLASDQATLQDLKAQSAEAKAKSHEDSAKLHQTQMAIENERTSCDANVTAFAQQNADLLDPRQRFSALNDDGAKIEKLFAEECPLIAIGGVMYAYFDEGDKHAAAYAKELRKEYTGNARFIKSDNGWVIN